MHRCVAYLLVVVSLIYFPWSPEPFLVVKTHTLHFGILALAMSMIVPFRKSIQNYFFPIEISFFLAFLAWNLISICWSTNHAEAILECQRLGYLALLMFAVSQCDSKKVLQSLLPVAPIVGSIAATLGLLEYFNLFWLNDITSGFLIFDLQLSRDGSLLSVAGHQNLLGQVFLMTVPTTYWLIWKRETRQYRWHFMLAVQLLCLIITFSRASWIATGAVLVACLVIQFRHTDNTMQFLRRHLAFISLIMMATCMIFLLPPSNNDQVSRATRTNQHVIARGSSGRLKDWAHTTRMVRDHPVIGVGSGNFKILFPKYRAHHTSKRTRVHNDYLQILSETGILGLSLWLFFLMTMIKSVRAYIHREEVMFAACICGGYLLEMLVSYDFYTPVSSMNMFIGFGLILAAKQNSPPTRIARPNSIFISTVVACILAMALYSEVYLSRVTYYRVLAIANSSRQEWTNTIRTLDMGLTLAPWSHKMQYRRGIAAFMQKQYPEAASYFRSAIHLNPNNTDYHFHLGKALELTGDHYGATQAWQQGLDIEPDHEAMARNLKRKLSSHP